MHAFVPFYRSVRSRSVSYALHLSRGVLSPTSQSKHPGITSFACSRFYVCSIHERVHPDVTCRKHRFAQRPTVQGQCASYVLCLLVNCNKGARRHRSSRRNFGPAGDGAFLRSFVDDAEEKWLTRFTDALDKKHRPRWRRAARFQLL